MAWIKEKGKPAYYKEDAPAKPAAKRASKKKTETDKHKEEEE